MKRVAWVAVLMLACSVGGAAQMIQAPASWDKLADKADNVVKVTMDKKMLQFASQFMKDDDDKEGQNLVKKLNGIYVRSLTFSKEGMYTEADVEPIRAQLQGAEWMPMVQVESTSKNKSAKGDREKVDIYLKSVNNQVMGMVILAQEPTELTLVHLDGPLDPKDLDGLSGNFGIPKDVHVPKSDSAAAVKPAVKK